MRRTEALQGVRMIKFLSVYGRYEASELSQLEAAELLGTGERTFRRWCERFEEDGEAGLLDRRLGKVSGKRVPVDREAEVEALYRTRYLGFTAKHFHEHLVGDHNFAWGYTWTEAFLHSKGLLERAKRRGAHRRKRPRRPMPGMMLHQDGSRHDWLQSQSPLDLIVTMDDATSQVLSAFLVAEEGTASSFRGLAETFGAHGLPLSLYTDRGSHYFYTPEAGGKADKSRLTQVGRALAQLGVEHIAAYSPAGPRALGAAVPDPAGQAAEGAGAQRHRHAGRGQCFPSRRLHSRPQRPFRRQSRTAGFSLRGHSRCRSE